MENLVQKFPIPYQNLETLLKCQIVRMDKKTLAESNLKEINNLINNQTFMIEEPKDAEPVTTCMDVYKAKIQSDGSLSQRAP